jgi:hypothetical protein
MTLRDALDTVARGGALSADDAEPVAVDPSAVQVPLVRLGAG